MSVEHCRGDCRGSYKIDLVKMKWSFRKLEVSVNCVVKIWGYM